MGVDCEHDWLIDDVFGLSANFICKILNSRFDLSEICELFLDLVELSPRLTLLRGVI